MHTDEDLPTPDILVGAFKVTNSDGTPLTFENAVKPASVAAKHLASGIPQTGDATTSSFAVAIAVTGGVAVLGGAHFARRRDD